MVLWSKCDIIYWKQYYLILDEPCCCGCTISFIFGAYHDWFVLEIKLAWHHLLSEGMPRDWYNRDQIPAEIGIQPPLTTSTTFYLHH